MIMLLIEANFAKKPYLSEVTFSGHVARNARLNAGRVTTALSHIRFALFIERFAIDIPYLVIPFIILFQEDFHCFFSCRLQRVIRSQLDILIGAPCMLAPRL